MQPSVSLNALKDEISVFGPEVGVAWTGSSNLCLIYCFGKSKYVLGVIIPGRVSKEKDDINNNRQLLIYNE